MTDFKSVVSTNFTIRAVVPSGVEPELVAYKATILPLNYDTIKLVIVSACELYYTQYNAHQLYHLGISLMWDWLVVYDFHMFCLGIHVYNYIEL